MSPKTSKYASKQNYVFLLSISFFWNRIKWMQNIFWIADKYWQRINLLFYLRGQKGEKIKINFRGVRQERKAKVPELGEESLNLQIKCYWDILFCNVTESLNKKAWNAVQKLDNSALSDTFKAVKSAEGRFWIGWQYFRRAWVFVWTYMNISIFTHTHTYITHSHTHIHRATARHGRLHFR